MAGNRAPKHIYTGMTSVLYHVVNNSFVALSWLALQLSASASAPGSQLPAPSSGFGFGFHSVLSPLEDAPKLSPRNPRIPRTAIPSRGPEGVYVPTTWMGVKIGLGGAAAVAFRIFRVVG